MTIQNYNEDTKQLAMRVYTDKGFDCTELLDSRDGIDWLPIAQALCVRFFNRRHAHIDTIFFSISSVIKYWKYEDEWLEEHEAERLVTLDDSIDCDWVSVFKAVLGRCDDATGCIIQLPMGSAWAIPANKPSYDDMACRCWRDEDAEVIRTSLDAGVQIRKEDWVKKDAVLCWCSESVCDLIFERMGWDYATMDYSTCYSTFKWPEVIRTSGNLHAFETVRRYAPESLPLDDFNLNDLFREQRYEIFRAVLALREDGSVKTPKAKSFLLDSAGREDSAAVELILKKMLFSKAAVKDIVATASMKAGEGDAYDIILREFGTSPAGKPTKRSMAQCFKDAQIGAETGNVNLIAELEPHVGKVKPQKVVDLLERAAAYSDKATVNAIFKLFGRPESLASAFCVAIRNGNEETARALRAKGASLTSTASQRVVDGKYARGHAIDEGVFVQSALDEFPIPQFFVFVAPSAHLEDVGYIPYGAKYPGEYCHKDKAVELVRRLFESRSLKKGDVAALGYELLYRDSNLGIRMVEEAVPVERRSALLSQLIGTTLDHGSGDVIDFAYENVTEGDLLARFKVVRGFMTQRPDALARCIRHLPSDAVKPTEAMWKSLIASGHLDELEIVCHWTQCSEDDVETALVVANELGKVEAVATLLKLRDDMSESLETKSIEL